MLWKLSILLLILPSCVESFVTRTTHRSSSSSVELRLFEADLTSWVNTANQLSPTVTQQSLQEIVEQLPASVLSAVQVVNDLPTSVKFAIPLLPFATAIASTFRGRRKAPDEPTYPESLPATYELSDVVLPMEFGDAAFVRPLLKQTQLEYRPLRVVYDANKDGYDAKIFHQKVDGQGAAVILAKSRGQWFGGYNPRGWASLGGSRPSRASFLFYKKPFFGGWEKLRALGGGGMSCGNDLFDCGIYMGAEGFVVPLNGVNRRTVSSRLGTYFEARGRSTLLPRAGVDSQLQELKVLVGVYADGEDIPNSGGVLDLGLY